MFDQEKLRATLDELYADREGEVAPMPEAEQAICRDLRGTGAWK